MRGLILPPRMLPALARSLSMLARSLPALLLPLLPSLSLQPEPRCRVPAVSGGYRCLICP